MVYYIKSISVILEAEILKTSFFIAANSYVDTYNIILCLVGINYKVLKNVFQTSVAFFSFYTVD